MASAVNYDCQIEGDRLHPPGKDCRCDPGDKVVALVTARVTLRWPMGTSDGSIDEDMGRPGLSGEDRRQEPADSVVNADERSCTPVSWQYVGSSETSPSNDKHRS
jgi:hypothetical protein